MSYDLVIHGGTIIDGSGAPHVKADLAITDGRIAAIGAKLQGADMLDARGKIVAPGFIDIHTHYDPQVLWDPELTPSSWHGVTSVVAGNCGFGVAPVRPEGRSILIGTLEKVEDIDGAAMEAGIDWNFETYGEYLAALERRGLAINFGGYVGHTPVRVYVMGEASYERAATDAEIKAMKQLVAQSLREGALGVSTDRAGFILGHGGKPVPSVVASQEETEELLAVVGEIGRGIAHVAPGENYDWLPALQRRIGRPLNWSAVLSYPQSANRDHRKKIAMLREARAAGGDLWAQVTCRPIQQLISLMTPYSYSQIPGFERVLAAAPHDRAAIYRDEAWRAELRENLKRPGVFAPRFDVVRVAETTRHQSLTGQTIAELARGRNVHPFDLMFDLALEEDLATRFSVTFANDDETAVRDLLLGEGCIIGLSDAGAHAAQICDAVLPTDFLSRWVRDRALMPLEAGVHKLTGELADLLQIERGYLREGLPADVVVFDYGMLSTGPIRRVHDLPGGGDRLIADAPTGIEHILVNGVAIRRDGAINKQALARGPGQILRNA
jgi:N-acyl-D-aspartate/D-glutamate deacylase